MEIKKKKISRIIYLIVTIFLIILISYKYKENEYYNNYFYYNEKELYIIKEYISKNNIKGHIYTDLSKYTNLVEIKKGEYNCFYGSCFSLKGNITKIIKNININYLFSSSGIITINTIHPLYGDKNNQIYYSKGYYKGKKELDKIDGSDFNVIYKIFNDDWGVINGCYGCVAGAWD